MLHGERNLSGNLEKPVTNYRPNVEFGGYLSSITEANHLAGDLPWF